MSTKASEKIIEQLGIAYKTEVEGYAFYNSAAAIIEDERGRNIFKHLAAEELDHMAVVSAITESLKKGTGWTSYEAAIKAGKKGAPIYPEKSELLERLKKNRSDLNAVKIGMDIEDKAITFYTKLLKDAHEPEQKVVLTQLLEMEKAHLKLLRWESESLVGTGFWCDMMEYSVEKETE